MITTLGQELLQLDQQIQASQQTRACIEALIVIVEEGGIPPQLQLLKDKLTQHKAAQEHLAESSKNLQAKLETAKTDFVAFKQLNTALTQINGKIAGINEEISKIAPINRSARALKLPLSREYLSALEETAARCYRCGCGILSIMKKLYLSAALT